MHGRCNTVACCIHLIASRTALRHALTSCWVFSCVWWTLRNHWRYAHAGRVSGKAGRTRRLHRPRHAVARSILLITSRTALGNTNTVNRIKRCVGWAGRHWLLLTLRLAASQYAGLWCRNATSGNRIKVKARWTLIAANIWSACCNPSSRGNPARISHVNIRVGHGIITKPSRRNRLTGEEPRHRAKR